MNYSIAYPNKISIEDLLNNTPDCKLSEFDGYGKNRKNSIIQGDNILALKNLHSNEQVKGKVRCIYIDPPYSTQRVFNGKSVWYQEGIDIDHNVKAYEDKLSGAEFLEFLRRRLIFLREILSNDGTIYVHLDEKMAFPIKVIMDELFGENNFRNWITRRKCSSKNYTRKKFGNISDYIICYSKSKNPVWNQQFQEWEEDHSKIEYPRIDEKSGRRYKLVPIYAQGVRNGETGKPWRGMLPPKGKHWFTSPKELDILDNEGRIYWSPTGNPRKKVYLDESPGIAYSDIWLEFRDAHNQNVSVTGYPTEKNLEMLEMIVRASSHKGDMILDAFCGSGTTLEAASAWDRLWIGIDSSKVAIETSINRMKNLYDNWDTPLLGNSKHGFSVYQIDLKN